LGSGDGDGLDVFDQGGGGIEGCLGLMLLTLCCGDGKVVDPQ
jgi:hypothetical protein